MQPRFFQYPCPLNHYTFVMAILACLILCSGMFSSVFASAAVPSNTANPAACQIKIQNIETAKGNLNQESQPPAHGWVKLQKLPDQWGKRWPDFHGMAWYKISVNYHCSEYAIKQPLALAIEGITQSGRVYINNDLLWQDFISPEYSSRSQHLPRMWNIPASSLNQGKNTIWIQVYGSITQKSGIGKLKAGSYDDVLKDFETWLLEKSTLLELNTMIHFVVAVFFFLAWIAIRNEKAFLWLAITGIAWVLYSTLIIYTEPIPWLSTVQLDRLQNIIFCFYAVFGCIGAWYFAHYPFPRIQKALLSIAAVAALCTAFSPEQYLNQVIQISFGFFVLVFAAKCITYPYLAYKAKTPETYLLALLYFIYLPVSIHDAHFMMTMEGRAWSPYTGPLTTMALGGVLAMRLARHTQQIKRFNKTLTEKVHQAKQELTLSLSHQHQLALENARLQERIHLSHDLHDGLGGSIVRSIIMLEQNNQVDKLQVLSILKLLRSDLRQVIDTGSSIGTKVPETPIEWGAPTRHRFIQLFEELDIRSTWQFSQQWQTVPSASQCLALTRVAEEALTNILKHSAATEVCIVLTEPATHELVLHIQDNGIGFDSENVRAGLHVGLHSMQARISRLGGKFQIYSQPGKTSIQVSLPLA